MKGISRDDATERLEGTFPSHDRIPDEYRLDPGRYEPLFLLNGEVRRWKGPLMDVSSPICLNDKGEIRRPVIGRVPDMDEEAALAALHAAMRAWDRGRGEWPRASLAARLEAIEAFVSSMIPLREEIVKLLMWEIGKGLEDSRGEFDRTIEYIRQTLGQAKGEDSAGALTERVGDMIAKVRSAPLGVSLLMGPFNNPLYETYTMLVPALVMGNTAVVKAPKFGSLLHQILFKALAECFPSGVVNFINGGETATGAIAAIMRTGHIDLFSFIGSGSGAAALIQQHPRPLALRSLLALEAKNAGLIMADADMETTVRECLMGTLGFNGQRCTALKILFVHESVAEEFLEKFCNGVNALPLGMPWSKGVKLTPLPEFDKARSMTAYVEDAILKGASVVNRGGGTACETLYSPAVVYPVARTAELYRREQFGPVVPICPYRDEEEFLDFVADSSYGQQVSLFGRNEGKIAKLVRYLSNQVCRINLNCKCQRGPDTLPFMGRKDSGMTTLSISETLRGFSVPSVVATRSCS